MAETNNGEKNNIGAKKKHQSLAVLLLAAGQSSRLGQAKQTVNYKGQPLLVSQIIKAQTITDEVYCVLGYQAEQFSRLISPLLKKGAGQRPTTKIVINKQWSQGMASSLVAGVKALPPEISAVMILLVDQWQIQTNDLQWLEQTWQNEPNRIVLAGQNKVSAPSTKNSTMGPPVIFPRCYFAELLQLKGQQGAKPLLKKYKNKLKILPMASAFVDLDTPEQLIKLKEQEALL